MTRLALCIGAPSSGTAWLYEQLRKSASIYVPPIKELRYLCGRHTNEEIQRAVNHARTTAAAGDDDERFLNGYSGLEPDAPRDYQQLMTSVTQKPWSIDITPAYSMMNAHQVEALARQLHPDTPVFYVIRDIVERSYSQANLHFHRHGTWDTHAPIADYMALLSEPSQIQRNDYVSTIDIWSKAFGKRNVHVMFYEDLVRSPSDSMQSIHDVLQVPALAGEPDLSKTDVGSTDNAGLVQAPKKLKGYIAAQSLSLIAKVATRYPDQAGCWFDHAMDQMNKSSDIQSLSHGGTVSARVLGNPGLEVVRRHFTTGPAEDITPESIDFLDRCVSMGENCEFGFFLRSLGNEKGGLFRWAVAHYDPLIAYLKNGCPPFFQFDQLVPYAQGMVRDLTTEFCFHTQMRSTQLDDRTLVFSDDEITRRKLHETELAKVNYLRDRFLKNLRSENSIFILKRLENLSDEEIRQFEHVLCTFRDPLRTRIIVALQTDVPEKVGVMERMSDSVHKGYVSSFAPYSDAGEIDKNAWVKLINTASRLPALQQMPETDGHMHPDGPTLMNSAANG